MTLELTLPPELEDRLRKEAERQGLPPDAVTLKLLEQHLPSPDRGAGLQQLFAQWQAEDEAMTEEEMAENLDVLRAIDEDRPSYRKLFTDILRDESR